MKRPFVLLSSVALSATAMAGSPNVTTITPAVAQRGTEVEVQVSGSRLADARGLLFNEPGIEVLSVKEAAANKFTAKLKVAPDARLGEYIYRGVSNSGIADTRLFYVSPFPVQKESEEDKGDPYKVQSVPLGVTIYGSTPGEDQDHFEVEAKKGQRITAEVIGVRLSTQQQYDPYMIVTNATGEVLATMDDGSFTRQDPALSILAPADGKYRIVLKEATNSGQGACNYILHLGMHPRPVVAYPGGGKAGTEIKVQMLGDAGGPFEQTVKLPNEPDSTHELIAAKDGLLAPQANFLRVSDFGNELEFEPNNDAISATKAKSALPLAFNGIIQEAGDIDFFKFSAKKDETFDFTVFARALRSPIDPVLAITKADGGGLANNDDANGMPDSYQRWKAPADGEFCLSITDQLKRGGPLFTYRVEVKPVRPILASYLPEMVINSSQERRAIPVPKGNRYATLVRVKRTDVGGDVVLEPKGLPSGVSIDATKIDKSVDTIAMVFEAKPDADAVHKKVQVVPKLADASSTPNVVSKVEHRVEISENGNNRAYYGVNEPDLALAVTEEVPVLLELHQPKVPILQNGQMAVKIAVNRKTDKDGKPVFNGPIQAQVLYGPPGIGTPGVVTIAEGAKEGSITISANGNAPVMKWKTCVVGSLDLGKGATWISTGLIDLEVAAPFATGTLVRTFIDQDSDGTMTLKLEHKAPFEGKAKVALVGLPEGVTADEKEVTKDDKEVKFTLKAGPKAQVGQHKTVFASFTLVKDGEPMMSTIASGGILRVDKATTKVADAK